MIQHVIPQINQEMFYVQRDARIGIDYPVSQLAPRRIAVVVPAKIVRPEIGIELALYWAVSIVRRMGRPFAELVIVTSDEFRHAIALTGGRPGSTIEQLIVTEATSADPFAPMHWRSWTNSVDFADAETIIWLGALPLPLQNARLLIVNASGWVSAVQEPSEGELSLIGSDFDAAPAAVVFAVCMAAARIFSSAFGSNEHPHQIAFALDSGLTSIDSSTCRDWMQKGKSLDPCAPWKGDIAAAPELRKLLVVSAGGIGGNLCQILCDSFFRLHSAIIVEPDKFELSNLNRAVGLDLRLALAGYSKAAFAAEALRQKTEDVIAIEQTYESWITEERSDEFRQPGTAVAVGVDQIKTRLSVGSDWPWILVNGSTAGVRFQTSIHCPEIGGCIGCWYGQSEASYTATRTPMACAAGIAAATPARAVQLSSYPFVSVAAAAHMTALLMRAADIKTKRKDYAGSLLAASLQGPENAQLRQLAVDERCLLLCREPYLQPLLGRVAEGF